jgi:hypothetical protein
MPHCNWNQVFDSWFAIYFAVEDSEQMVVLNGLDEQMALNRFEALLPGQKPLRVQGVAFGISSLLSEMTDQAARVHF